MNYSAAGRAAVVHTLRVPAKKLAIVLALIAVVGGLYFWQDARTRKTEDLLAARELASRDMKELNDHENDAAFEPRLTARSRASIYCSRSAPATR